MQNVNFIYLLATANIRKSDIYHIYNIEHALAQHGQNYRQSAVYFEFQCCLDHEVLDHFVC